ncbi:MAG: uracil-DNA glycosylase [Gammaproteobacteria bacterium]|nr:uracil-DNA glycosylase [Gammaproteobacteria bacterium]MCH9744702.1 uracil-DNA glycosylase [Gammaproteobacteria bacterium]
MSTDAMVQTWSSMLAEEKQKPYFKQILAFLAKEMAQQKTLYPARKDIFNAFKLTEFEDVKVVIIGQDPYHGPNQAHGLCFSVCKGVALPPSLQNIYKELHSDLGIETPNHGSLERWGEQGVLLLNTALTVEAHKPQSHSKIGWQKFTDRVIECLNEHPQGIVYLLWGSYAQSKIPLIDSRKHKILKCPHPSPLSAHRGFLGCQHFSKANMLLESMNRPPIDWSL